MSDEKNQTIQVDQDFTRADASDERKADRDLQASDKRNKNVGDNDNIHEAGESSSNPGKHEKKTNFSHEFKPSEDRTEVKHDARLQDNTVHASHDRSNFQGESNKGPTNH